MTLFRRKSQEFSLKEVYDSGTVPCVVKVVHGYSGAGPWRPVAVNTKLEVVEKCQQKRAMAQPDNSPLFCSIPFNFRALFQLDETRERAEGQNPQTSLENILQRRNFATCTVRMIQPPGSHFLSFDNDVTSRDCTGNLVIKSIYEEEFFLVKFPGGQLETMPVYLPIKVTVKKRSLFLVRRLSDQVEDSNKGGPDVISVYPRHLVEACRYKYNLLEPCGFLQLSGYPSPPPSTQPRLPTKAPPIPERKRSIPSPSVINTSRKLPLPPPADRPDEDLDYEEVKDWDIDVPDQLKPKEQDSTKHLNALPAVGTAWGKHFGDKPLGRRSRGDGCEEVDTHEMPVSDGVGPKSAKTPQTDVPQDLTKLGIDDIVQCLRELKLEQYAEAFRDNNIDGDLLSTLDKEMLISDLDMTEQDANKLWRFVVEG